MKTFLIYFFLGIVLLAPSLVEGQQPDEQPETFTPFNTMITLFSFETTYGDYGRYHGRAHNIRHAAELLSGITLQPNERFSFNERVGERTRENDFRVAPVIGSGRLRQGYGGGVCQLASTIYAAALYSGLRIIEHHQHSRISNYIRPGLDATVDWGTKDLVFENPYSFPITLEIGIYPGRNEAEETISASFSAPASGYEINVYFNRHILASPETIESTDQNLPSGTRIVDERGTPGVRVIMRRRITNPVDGSTINERQYMVYPVSNRFVRVSPSP